MLLIFFDMRLFKKSIGSRWRRFMGQEMRAVHTEPLGRRSHPGGALAGCSHTRGSVLYMFSPVESAASKTLPCLAWRPSLLLC